MESFIWFLITLAVAFLCGAIAIRLKIPAGGMIGGMIGVAALNIVTGRCLMYSQVRVAVQICLGAMSGSRVGRREVGEMKRLILPIGLMFCVCLVLNVGFGILLMKTTTLDMRTALLSITPGGATDMVFVAADIGADTGMVGIMQTLRMIFSNCILTILFVALIKRHEARTGKKCLRTEEERDAQNRDASTDWRRVAGMYAAASCGGLLFRKLGVPGGVLVGAMVFTVIYNCVLGKARYPVVVKKYQQVFTGAYIGVSITGATLAQIPQVALGMLVSIVDILCYVALMSFILRRTSRMDYGTSLLCSTPGGIGEVSMLSEELGTDTPTIAVMNTARMILIVATFPAILQLISALL